MAGETMYVDEYQICSQNTMPHLTDGPNLCWP